MELSDNIRDLIKILMFILIANYFIGAFFVLLFNKSQTIDDDYAIAMQKLYLLNSDNKEKIIFFGSSMSREGLNLHYFKEEFQDYRVYNFSISSGKPSDFYFIYNKIKDKKKVKFIIITTSPWIFQKKYTEDINSGNDPFTTLIFDPIVVANVVNLRDVNFSWYIKESIFSMIPFYQYNDYLKKIIDHRNMSLWKTKEERMQPQPITIYRYSENKPESYFLEELGKEKNYHEYSSINYCWDNTKNIQIKSLNLLLSKINHNLTSVAIIDMPVNPNKLAFYDEELSSNYLEIMNNLSQTAKFFDLSAQYSADNFIDFNHLNEKGRNSFSYDLRNLIKDNYGF
jgi:hypothetical protein